MEDKIIFAVTEEDAQIMAAQMGVERLTDDQIERIRKLMQVLIVGLMYLRQPSEGR